MGDLTKNFSRKEFQCSCGCGAADININLVRMLQDCRDSLKIPLVITSGVRCPAHNARVGGKPNSSHLKGLAADIACIDSHTRYRLLKDLIHRFSRIEVAKSWIHVDVDQSKPQNVVFLEE